MPVHQKEETKNGMRGRNITGSVTKPTPPPPQKPGIGSDKFTLCKTSLTTDNTPWFFKTAKANTLLL